MHAELLTSFAIVMHDFTMLLAVVSLLLLSGYRARPVLAGLCGLCGCGGGAGNTKSVVMNSMNKNEASKNQTRTLVKQSSDSSDAAFGEDDTVADLSAADDAASDEADKSARKHSDSDQGEEVNAFRGMVYSEAMEVLIDVPFFLAGLFVIATLWRLDMLLALLCGSRAPSSAPATPPASPYAGGSSTASRRVAESAERSKRSWERRHAVASLAATTLRDIGCLPLFVLLVGTLYRLPAILLQLRARWSRPSFAQPQLNPNIIRVQFPENGGPKVRIAVYILLPAVNTPSWAGSTIVVNLYRILLYDVILTLPIACVPVPDRNRHHPRAAAAVAAGGGSG
jgi:hypothetical protein